ncbi:hypothetical protein [Fluviispira vulneris]|uniref:hypothetical protein n=1 Tax=Fluviispira vulneris TaxID=2763012 RepID=UPI0016481BE8|nr:hypothetical protein [Fluviispira vulneris]
MSEIDTTAAGISTTTASPETSESAPAAAAERRTFKIDDAEISEDDLIAAYKSHKNVANEYGSYKAKAHEFLSAISENPELLLRELGHNPRDFYQSKLLEHLESEAAEAELTPEQRELRELKKWKDSIESEITNSKKVEEQKRAELEEQRIVEEIDTQIEECFRSAGITKPTIEMVADLAEQMLAEYKHSQTSIKAPEALKRAKKSFGRRLESYTNASPDAILDLLPQQYLDKIAEAYLSKKSGARVPSVRANPATAAAPQSKLTQSLQEFLSK